MRTLFILLLIAAHAGAANINSAATSSALNTAISGASAGDTIYVASGSFAWDVTLTKRVSIIGGGQGSGQTPGTTTIANTTGTIAIEPTLGSEVNQLRLAYFTLTKTSTSAFNPVVSWGNDTTHFNLGGTNPYNARLDHCTIMPGSGGVCVTTWDTLYGVIDSCTFGSNSERHHYGIYGETVYTEADFNNSVNYPWAPGLAGNGKSIYIEDCIFWPSSDGWRAGTSNEGGRICWRYNTVNIASGGYSQALWDIHGPQGSACAAWGHEYYGNISLTGTTNAIADVRSGRNLMFWNAGSSLAAACQNYWGQLSVVTSVLPAEQQIHHAYYWNNRSGTSGAKQDPYTGTTYNGTAGGYVNPPQGGSNYYGENTSPGITSGLLASRPATGTEGQGYWAVSAGSSAGLTNLTDFVGDKATYPSRQTIGGTLYTWTSGAWVNSFTPYTYPHPLIAGGDVILPTVSTVTINTGGSTATFAMSESCTVAGAAPTMTLTGGAVTLTYSSGSGSTALVYSLSRTVYVGETGTASYTQPGNGIEDLSGNDLTTFSGSTVINSSTQAIPNRPGRKKSKGNAGAIRAISR